MSACLAGRACAYDGSHRAHPQGCGAAILKARSPDCGCTAVYDGTFSRTLTDGDGVTAAALRRAGIELWTEEEL